MWFVAGALAGAGLVALALTLNNRGTKTTWYDWVIAAIGVLLILFTLQNAVGSVAEYEDKAVTMFLIFTGIPGLLLLALAWQFIWRRNRSGS